MCPNRVNIPHFLEELRKIMKNLRQVNRCPGRDSNRRLSEYKARSLPLYQPARIYGNVVVVSESCIAIGRRTTTYTHTQSAIIVLFRNTDLYLLETGLFIKGGGVRNVVKISG